MDDGTTGSSPLRTGVRAQSSAALLAIVFAGVMTACAAGPTTGNASSEFRAHMSAPDREHWFENDAASWARSLTRDDAARVAEIALHDASPGVRLFGAQLLFDHVSDEQGANAAADLVVRGDDLTPLAWSWLHADDPDRTDKRLALIRAALDARKDSLSKEQRQRVDKLLCPGGDGCR